MTGYSNMVVEPLNNSHDRPCFHCGETTLDDYIRKQAKQDVKHRISQGSRRLFLPLKSI